MAEDLLEELESQGDILQYEYTGNGIFTITYDDGCTREISVKESFESDEKYPMNVHD